jgi:hypothetical protein
MLKTGQRAAAGRHGGARESGVSCHGPGPPGCSTSNLNVTPGPSRVSHSARDRAGPAGPQPEGDGRPGAQ